MKVKSLILVILIIIGSGIHQLSAQKTHRIGVSLGINDGFTFVDAMNVSHARMLSAPDAQILFGKQISDRLSVGLNMGYTKAKFYYGYHITGYTMPRYNDWTFKYHSLEFYASLSYYLGKEAAAKTFYIKGLFGSELLVKSQWIELIEKDGDYYRTTRESTKFDHPWTFRNGLAFGKDFHYKKFTLTHEIGVLFLNNILTNAFRPDEFSFGGLNGKLEFKIIATLPI